MTQGNVGYAFINFVCEEQALRFWHAFQGFSDWAVSSRKVCSLSWSDQGQGREANIKRYRNNPVISPAMFRTLSSKLETLLNSVSLLGLFQDTSGRAAARRSMSSSRALVETRALTHLQQPGAVQCLSGARLPSCLAGRWALARAP